MTALSIQVPFPVFQDRDGQPLDNGYVWIGTANLYPITNPVVAYFDAALTIVAAQPLRTLNGYISNAGTPAQVYVDGVNFSILVQDSKGTMVYNFPDGTGISQNAAGVIYDPAGSGAVATNVQTKLRESTNAVNDFGADNTGTINATTALLNFFTHCINTGTPGHIPAGDYLVTAGVLAFDNGFVDALWPDILTDGYGAVTLKRADGTDAPMISITNGTATSGVDNVWQGGSLGGMTFDQNGKTTASNQHGLLLRGIVGTNFGYMRANSNGGSCIHIERKLFGGNNPDPYNVAACYFQAAEANFCGGAAFYNDNYAGLSGNTINYVRAIENANGAFYGFGAGNNVNSMSVGSCQGWALGNPTDATGGSASRFTLGIAEFDDVQYGIDMRRVSNSDFGTVRFVHRYNFGPFNPSSGYWPRIAVQVSTNSVVMNNLRIIDRIEAGGTKPDLGQFFDFGNGGGNTQDIQIQRQIIDNASFGFTIADYYTNFNANTTVQYTQVSGYPIIDTLKKTVALGRAPTTFAVPNGGFTGAANTVQYSTALFDPTGSYNPATWTYTTGSPGAYRIAARIVLAVAIGTRIRVGIMVDGTIAVSRFFYATTANAQCYDIDYEANLTAGATININADQNTGGAVNLTTMTTNNENTFFVTQI
jgi:hypothetical protein